MSTPNFQTPSTNPFNLSNVGTLATPTFVDLDGDGDLDALVGNGNGDMLYYQNTGSATAPAFAAPVTDPFGLTNNDINAAPTFADLDGDGDLDAFVGSFDGNIRYFENTGSATAPAFAAPVTDPFGLADVGSLSTPTFADLDGDGDLDAFVGSFDGNIRYFENTGSATAPAFAAPVTDPFGLAGVGFSAKPTFADLDGDGDLDAFVGNSYGDTLYFENTGGATAPAFAAPVTDPFSLANVGSFTTPTFADLDGDGDKDAFVGNGNGDTLYFQNNAVACFQRGTRILTRTGYVPVENLQPGDQVQTLGHGWRPVVWLGVRHIPRTDAGDFPREVQPIRVAQNAFGPGLPSRDLWLSPAHAVFFRDHLIPVKELVNGTTVTRDGAVESITYYHVLLDRHAVLFSETLPTESYSPQENLDLFENAETCPAPWRQGHITPIMLAADCHPRVTAGPVVQTARGHLARLAGAESLVAVRLAG